MYQQEISCARSEDAAHLGPRMRRRGGRGAASRGAGGRAAGRAGGGQRQQPNIRPRAGTPKLFSQSRVMKGTGLPILYTNSATEADEWVATYAGTRAGRTTICLSQPRFRAVGQTVFLITPPCLSILAIETPTKGRGGCSRLTELSPTATAPLTFCSLLSPTSRAHVESTHRRLLSLLWV